MAMTGKIRQKVRDGSLREMWREAKWMFTYIRRYRAVVGIHILLGILGTALSLLSSVAMKTLIDVVTGFQTGAIFTAAAWMAGMLLGSAAMQAAASRIAAVINIRVQNGIQAEVYDRMLRTDWASLEQFRSGDLLNRNTRRRVEVFAEVRDGDPRREILHLVDAIRMDNQNSWEMLSDGSYVKDNSDHAEPLDSHTYLHHYFEKPFELPPAKLSLKERLFGRFHKN